MNRRALFLLPLLATAARAHSLKVGDIKIGHAWALPTTLSEGQVFFPLFNSGKAPDSLIAARSDSAATIELRANNRYDDPPLGSFELAPLKPFAMRPTAHHLRLIGLRKPLMQGDSFILVADFTNAGEVEIVVNVETAPGD